VLEASQRLAGLTDDLLDATRLQANRLELRPEPLEVRALVRRVVKRQRAAATARHTITLASPVGDDDARILVEADGRRLEQVLTNLLSNAVKYSPAGGVIAVEVVRCAHAAPDGGPAASIPATTADGAAARGTNNQPDTGGAREWAREWARVEVRDQGMGIPADQFERIFGRFGRASNAREQGIPGTGLGLYLCRELIERQGGRIWFESHRGDGAGGGGEDGGDGGDGGDGERAGEGASGGTSFIFELPRWTEPV
jgi:signal transduction histidine kinase